MAWVKVPAENHPLFHEALPDDPRVETLKMFGGVAAKVNGHIFAGLFGRSTILSLSDVDQKKALALEGAGPFDPMGNGRVMSEKVMMPEAIMDDAHELRAWIRKAFEHTASLPEKIAKPAKKKAPAAKKSKR
jgi:TfoX/Sxy family transcriptional regulator of competence genes